MWGWIAFLGGTAALLLWMSRAQPFPEIGTRWAWLMLTFAGILAMSTNSPRITTAETPIVIAGGMGALGVIVEQFTIDGIKMLYWRPLQGCGLSRRQLRY